MCKIQLSRGGCVLICKSIHTIIQQMILHPGFNNQFHYQFQECDYEHPWGGELWRDAQVKIEKEHPGGKKLFSSIFSVTQFFLGYLLGILILEWSFVA